MNSTEHLDHTAETNNSLLFPAIFRHSWGVFKKKWSQLFLLSLIPVIFLVAVYAILISGTYIIMKLVGNPDVIATVFKTFQSSPRYLTAIMDISGIVVMLGTIYFALRSTIASVKVLESESQITVRHAWHGISFKSISALLLVSVTLGLILIGGYILLFIPMLFLITFYCNAIFVNLVDGKRGIDALVASRNYVKGYGAIVFVNLLVIMAIALIFGLIFRLILGIGVLMVLAVYFGKLSLVVAILIAVGLLIIATILLVLWKSFAFVFMYSMFTKLKSLKAHHEVDLNSGRKTVKVWIILSMITVAIVIGVMAALNEDSNGHRPMSPEEARMMYTNNTDFNDNSDLGY